MRWRTSRFIRALWNAAGRRRQREPEFLSLIVRCGWINNGKTRESRRESTRLWRNRNIAQYLNVQYKSDDEQLAERVARTFPRLKEPLKLLGTPTGIIHYRHPLRPGILSFTEQHARSIAPLFRYISSKRGKPDERVRRVINGLANLGKVRIGGRKVSLLNGLTPALACLDPFMRFPIIGNKTARLLRALGKTYDAEGAVELSHLIGHNGINGIRHSFDLDVYAATNRFPKMRPSVSLPSSALDDINQARAKGEFKKLSKTERRAIIDARLGQGSFRKDLERVYKRQCAVTRTDIPKLLRASHIKP